MNQCFRCGSTIRYTTIDNYCIPCKRVIEEEKTMQRIVHSDCVPKSDFRKLVDSMIKESVFISPHDRPLVNSWIKGFKNLLNGVSDGENT